MKTPAAVATFAPSLLALSLLATTAFATPRPLSDAQLNHITAGEKFVVVGEISDTMTESGNPADPLLKNSWGLSMGPGTFLWVADNGTGFSTLYDPHTFGKIGLNVVIPIGSATPAMTDGAPTTGTPTGTTFTDFNFGPPGGPQEFGITQDGTTVHSLFLFDTEDGTISGWGLGLPDPTHAVIAVDQSASGVAFKGLTLADVGVGGTTPEIFAANFTGNQVEVFDSNFTEIGHFTDPSLPPGYSPFNVQELNGKIYVAFALHGDGIDEVDGKGLGFVDVFDLQGNKITTLVGNGPSSNLNAPWGLVIAPPSFGKFAGALLVGNFGDGAINAYDANTGKFLGSIKTTGEKSLMIDGLWALRVGPDGEVIFSSGPNNEANGLVGVILPADHQASWAFQSHVKLGR